MRTCSSRLILCEKQTSHPGSSCMRQDLRLHLSKVSDRLSPIDQRGLVMKTFCLICSFALLIPSNIWSQASSSTVRGTVRDQVQAVIPTAKVTLLNTATNVSRETETNEAGLYVFAGVIPGPYRLIAEFSGMQRF